MFHIHTASRSEYQHAVRSVSSLAGLKRLRGPLGGPEMPIFGLPHPQNLFLSLSLSLSLSLFVPLFFITLFIDLNYLDYLFVGTSEKILNAFCQSRALRSHHVFHPYQYLSYLDRSLVILLPWCFWVISILGIFLVLGLPRIGFRAKHDVRYLTTRWWNDNTKTRSAGVFRHASDLSEISISSLGWITAHLAATCIPERQAYRARNSLSSLFVKLIITGTDLGFVTERPAE